MSVERIWEAIRRQDWPAATQLVQEQFGHLESAAQEFFYLGVIALLQENYLQAKNYFENTLEEDPYMVDAWVNLGVTALRLGVAQEAVECFVHALILEENHEAARSNLAAIFIEHDRFDNALTHYAILLEQFPENMEYLYNAGVAEMTLGFRAQAIQRFEKILRLDPKHVDALKNLAALYMRQGERSKALEILRSAQAICPQDPILTHLSNALRGAEEASPSCPEYAKQLFDQYALYYDAHMQETLAYVLPAKIAVWLNTLQRFSRALDLGCGTGLVGAYLRQHSDYLVGVDISPKMVTQAEKKEIYDVCVAEDITQYLQHNVGCFDGVICADVLPYFGELDTLFSLVYQHLNAEGYFIFSVEQGSHAPWQLARSARFQHHPNYITELCLRCGFSILQTEKIDVARDEKGVRQVHLYLLTRA
ncbi:MAG: tetratricopeptide repeat protein [Legionellaceae bacterium]|nr:tetratricopeptide repeat protein [Legionellaceae bacterium]